MISHGKRWQYAFRVFFSLIFHGRIAPDILAAGSAARPSEAAPAAPPPAAPVGHVDHGDRAVQMLALLQRDGRLIDFLMEDLTAYPDAQVGAAVRDVHSGCRQALGRYLTLSPVLAEDEGRTVIVARGEDPARVKVVGNASAPPPLTGVLRHRGWDVTRIELPPLASTGRTVVAPAEVEVT